MAELQLDVESLRALLAVLDTGGMTKAAERLGVTQSAVSWKIKRLEERTGRPLLIREGHTFRPTRDGRALMDDARTIVELHDNAVWRLRNSGLRGKVRVGSNEEIDQPQIADLLGRFNRTHPDVDVEFVIDHSTRLTQLVDDGAIDVALIQVTRPKLRRDDAVLRTDELHWVTSSEWTYETGPVPLVTFGPECFYHSLSAPILRRARIPTSVAFSATTTRGVLGAVAAGLGVGVLSTQFISDDIIEWPRASSLPSLPTALQIARTVPGETPAVAQALVDVFSDQLDDAPVPAL